MKILITIINWNYTSNHEVPDPEIIDLGDLDEHIRLYIALSNGIILEMMADGDSVNAVEVIRELMLSAGTGYPIQLTAKEKEKLWLYRNGYECYKQGSRNSSKGYFFLNPYPQAEISRN